LNAGDASTTFTGLPPSRRVDVRRSANDGTGEVHCDDRTPAGAVGAARGVRLFEANSSNNTSTTRDRRRRAKRMAEPPAGRNRA